MGGTLEVQSKLDLGTTFTVVLKFERYKGQIEEQVNEEVSSTGLEGKRILLCEDHPLNRQMAIKLLEKKGVSVDAVENGQEEVARFQNSAVGYYDLILMDLRMPIMGGSEATETIRNLQRADAKSIPIIAMTANAFDDDVKHCLAVGMNDHISKPLNVEKMYQTIADYIGAQK